MAKLRIATALFILVVWQAPSHGQALAANFSSVVDEVLRGQTDGMITELDDKSKTALIACVNKVLQGVANGRKRFVLQGETADERERRFGIVVQENRAEWKQAIARACASVALAGRRESRSQNAGRPTGPSANR